MLYIYVYYFLKSYIYIYTYILHTYIYIYIYILYIYIYIYIYIFIYLFNYFYIYIFIYIFVYCFEPRRFLLTLVLEGNGAAPFGRVYKAVSGENTVAIKQYKERRGSRHNALVEVLIMEEIGHHPNVACLLDAWTTAADAACLVMEFYPNTFRGLINNRALLPAEARSLFSGLTVGLAHIHARDFIHMDVKPENIAVGFDDVPKLLDFGNTLGSDRRWRRRITLNIC